VTLRGSVADFPVEAVVQLIAATRKTGQLEVRSAAETGTLGFADGRLVSALSGDDDGDHALGGVFAVRDGEFEFVPWAEPPEANLDGKLDELLDRAVAQRERIIADRAVIPDDRMRFKLSGRAAEQGEVRLSADQWRTLLAVNGERDLHGIARELRLGRLSTLAVLSGLVRGGIVDTLEPPSEPIPLAADGAAGPRRAPAEWSRPDEARAAPRASSAPESLTPSSSPQSDLEPAIADRLSALTGHADHVPQTEPWREPAEEPADDGADQRVAEERRLAEERRKKGLFAGLFRPREESPLAAAPVATAPTAVGREPTWSRAGMLASFANALLDEFTNGQYGGSTNIDDRMANRLMRVDEQAEPIDRALPVANDRIDVQALERANMPDRQVAPYIALFISHVYDDAERAFGKDRAKRGYRAVQERVLGQDAASLGSDLRLPRI
jgi:hypothetical protein